MQFADIFNDREVYHPLRLNGNYGDTLIWMGLLRLLQKHGVKHIGGERGTVPIGSFGYPAIPPEATTVIINGGGNFNELWKLAAYVLGHVLKNTEPHVKVVVGPQSCIFRTFSLKEFLKKYPDRDITLFAREHYSQQILLDETRGLPHVAVHLDHDLAFELQSTTPRYPEQDYALLAFRKDAESAGKPLPEITGMPVVERDISKNAKDMTELLKTIGQARVIHTDRLHVAILGCMMDREVTLYAGSYHKNRGVYEYSLKPRSDKVHFVE